MHYHTDIEDFVRQIERRIDTLFPHNFQEKLLNKHNDLLLEEILKNLNALTDPSTFQIKSKDSSTENLISSINEKFIIETIESEIEGYMTYSQHKNGIFTKEIEALQTKIHEISETKDYIKLILVMIEFLEILSKIEKIIRKNLLKKCEVCSPSDDSEDILNILNCN